MDELDPRDNLRARPSLHPSGTLIRRVALGSEAIYRILSENHRGVEVEVVEAPGLQPGARFTFAVGDVAAMADRNADDRDAQSARQRVRAGVTQKNPKLRELPD